MKDQIGTEESGGTATIDIPATRTEESHSTGGGGTAPAKHGSRGVKPVTAPKLKKGEARQLHECETVIREGLTTFMNVGAALATIRDHRLYREGFATFEEYCRAKWGMSKTHSNRLIAAASFAGDVMQPLGIANQVGEYTIRPLIGLPKFQARKALDKALATVGGDAEKLTAKDLTTTIREMGIVRPGAKPTKIPTEGPKAGIHHRPSSPVNANLIRRDDVLEVIDLWFAEHAKSFRGNGEAVVDALKRQVNDL